MPSHDLRSAHWWSQAWHTYQGKYVRSPAFQAYYLYFALPRGAKRLLELGAGSFKCTAQLCRWGYDCLGSDFAEDAVALAKQTYPEYAGRFSVMDATHLPLDDHSVDVCFHSGLFACFDEDDLIQRVLSEQVRVSRLAIICIVHNARNEQMVQLFRQRASQDPLYDIRFFEPEEMVALMQPFCRTVRLYPYGTLMCNRLIKYWRERHSLRLYYHLARRLWRLEQVERLMMVGFL